MFLEIECLLSLSSLGIYFEMFIFTTSKVELDYVRQTNPKLRSPLVMWKETKDTRSILVGH